MRMSSLTHENYGLKWLHATPIPRNDDKEQDTSRELATKDFSSSTRFTFHFSLPPCSERLTRDNGTTIDVDRLQSVISILSSKKKRVTTHLTTDETSISRSQEDISRTQFRWLTDSSNRSRRVVPFLHLTFIHCSRLKGCPDWSRANCVYSDTF